MYSNSSNTQVSTFIKQQYDSGVRTNTSLNEQSASENDKASNRQKYSKEVCDYCSLLYGRCIEELDEQAIEEARGFLEQDSNMSI